MTKSKIPYDFNPNRRDVMHSLCNARFSASEFRAVLFILNQTDGYLRPEDKIKARFFKEKTHQSHLRRTLGRLVEWNVVLKHRQVYSIRPPDEWSPEAFIQEKRDKIVTVPPEEPEPNRDKIVTVSPEEPEKSVTKSSHQVDKNVTLLASSKENYSKEKQENNFPATPPPEENFSANTPASIHLFKKTNRKRWGNLTQKEEFGKCETLVGSDIMTEAVNWALTSGITNIKSMISTAKKIRRDRETDRGSAPGEGNEQLPESEFGTWNVIRGDEEE